MLEMKALCVIILVLVLSGCVSPSHSMAGRSVVVGLDLSWTLSSNIPSIRFGYISTEAMLITKEHTGNLTKDYEKVSLFTAEGDIRTEMTVEK